MASPSRKHQVSLRGSSSKEITRDALLEKVSFERELRNYTRRAAAAALFIQKVWRRYHAAKKVAKQFKEEWEILIGQHDILITSRWVSHGLLRPFLFFATRLSTASRITCTRCMLLCFRTVLQSIDSTDPKKNFCSMVTGTPDERSTWIYQARKLVSICSYILHECDHTFLANGENKIVTSLIMQLVIALTDPRSWKSFSKANHKDACIAARKLVQFIASGGSGLYTSVRRHIMKFCTPLEKQSGICTDDHFLITASALTLALRPFHVVELCVNYVDPTDVQDAAEQYCIFLLTVPLLSQCLPRVLLPALKHESVLSPCLRTLLISKEKLFIEMSKLDQLKDYTYCYNLIPSCGWALANMISLVTEQDNGSIESGHFIQGLQSRAYVHSAISFSENLLHQLENIGCLKNRENDEHVTSYVPLEKAISTDVSLSPAYSESSVVSYVEAIKPVYQQWHLLRLLAISKKDISVIEDSDKLDLIDVAVFYSNILRMVSFLDPLSGSWPLLNMLSFTPGILVELWRVLEASLFCQDYHRDVSGKHMDGVSVTHEVVTGKKLGRIEKDAGYKWTSVLQRITGKSSNNADSDQYINSTIDDTLVTDSTSDLWDVESMRQGSQGISKGISCLLHVFSVTYAHLLLVLDDIEFHEKQVPFSLEQQRKIVAVLNTLVYNGLSHNTGDQNKPLMDAAIRCLHLLYERDCRHQFCPSSLWIAPARKGRPPIAAASRAHEAVTANLKSVDTLAGSCPSSVINKIPHVFPFEERVQMFREFVNMDKVSRRMAGEVTGPGPGSIEIVVRRDHIVEDGFKQLNFLGAKLKSCINVSFVSECGLPEAGLDYGGLSKEFLTDISKTAFDPRYGLFSQTSTSERCLIPNNAAKSVDNGIQMIEFLGRVVGKALYEGILLDYSFSLVFVQKLLGRYSFLDELSTLDPELYRNLMYVKHYEGDVRELALDFTVTEELLGRLVVTELKPGGKNMTVTNENKLQYVHAIADYKLNRQILPLANAFFRGLIDLISPSWLSLFNAIEFNQLLSGGNHDFDVDDLKSNTRYTGGYSEGSRTIKLFWEVIKELEPKERCMLLKFVTSCSRAPLLGFKHLQPTFTIHKVICDVPLWAMIGGQDVDRLPSASTCYNTLKLPTYKRASTLRSKLLYAVNSNAGFELS